MLMDGFKRCYKGLIYLLVALSVFLMPINVIGKSIDLNPTDENILYQTTDDVVVDDKLLIKKNTFLYGIQENDHDDTVYFQFGNGTLEFDKSKLKVVTNTSELPPYHNYSDPAMEKSIMNGQQVVTTNGSHSVFLQDTTYPVTDDSEGNEVLYIGNIAFSISNTTNGESELDEIQVNVEKDNYSADKETEIKLQATKNAWTSSTSKYFKVTEANLPIYDNRTGKLIEVGQLIKGQVYPRVGSYGPNWHKIQYGNINGFVYASGTEPVSSSNLKNINKTFSNQERAITPLYQVPVYDNSSGVLVQFGTLNKGKAYPVVSDYGNWWRIILSDRVGFVSKNAVKAEMSTQDNYFRVTVDNLPIYDNRTGKLVKVGTLTKGQVYPRVSSYGANWHKIQFGNMKGYVSTSGTEVATVGGLKSENKGFKNQAKSIMALQDVSVYDNTSGSLVQFGTLVKGKEYPIVSDYGNWFRVLLSNRIGYVHKDAVKLSFSKEDDYFTPMTDDLSIYVKGQNNNLIEVGYLKKGQTYTRISDYGNWHEIQFGLGKAYVWEAATKPSNGKQINNEFLGKSSKKMVTLAVDSSVYDYSGSQRVAFATLKKHSKISIIRIYGSWIEVDVAGRKGYVYKDSVKIPVDQEEKYFKVTGENVLIYLRENNQLNPVGKMISGMVYSRTRDYGNWHEMDFGGQTAYVSKAGTSFVTQPSNYDDLPSTPKKDKLLQVTTDANIYVKRNGKLKNFVIAGKDSYLYSMRDYGNWYEINIANTRAYINKNNVRSGVSIDQTVNGLTKEQIDRLLQTKFDDYIDITNAKGSRAIELGDLILDNNIVLMSLWEPVKYQELDWKMDPYNDNSWKLYFHSLRMVGYLLNAYEVSHDERYLVKAEEITEHWIEHNPNNKSSSNWAWADHAVSNRLLIMTYMLEILKDEDSVDYEFINKLLSSIREHVDYQTSSRTYRFPHNHGVMQDRSLIQTALTLSNLKESREWLGIANGRLEEQINAFVTDSGVHLEHSPYYHLYVIQLYNSVENLLASTDYSLATTVNTKLNKMKEYLAYIVKPDLALPYIGDSVRSVINSGYGNEYLEYVVSAGESGVKPTEIDKVYKDAGIAILRDEWKYGEDYRNMTHLVFHAGYHSNVHKHADDLSFVLSSLGEDIFTDAGKYTYNNNIWRDYFISTKAHNVVSVDYQSYEILSKNHGSFIKDYRLEENYSWIKGGHKLFNGVTYTREILYLRPNVLIVFDTLLSNSSHTYQQNFNLGRNLLIDKDTSNKDYLIAHSSNGDLSVNMKQLIPVDKVTMFKGHNDPNDKVNPVRGYASTATNELLEMEQIEFEKAGSNVEFITLISLDSSRFVSKVHDVQVTDNDNTKVVNYMLDNKEYTITLPNK